MTGPINLRAFYPTNITAAIYPITAIPARLALENKNWERAANLELQEIDLNWEQFPWQEAIHHFAKALGAVHMNDFETVEQKIEVLANAEKKSSLNMVSKCSIAFSIAVDFLSDADSPTNTVYNLGCVLSTLFILIL